MEECEKVIRLHETERRFRLSPALYRDSSAAAEPARPGSAPTILGVWNRATIKLTPYPNVVLSTGATIRFQTAEDPEKMWGPNLSGVWLDEASLMHHQAYLHS